jgi:hypothetical protein
MSKKKGESLMEKIEKFSTDFYGLEVKGKEALDYATISVLRIDQKSAADVIEVIGHAVSADPDDKYLQLKLKVKHHKYDDDDWDITIDHETFYRLNKD